MRCGKQIWVTGIVWILGMLAAQASVKPHQTYTGKLGSSPIVVEISIDDSNEVYGRYFQNSDLQDHVLSGERLKNGDLKLTVDRRVQQANKSTVILKPDGKGYTGQWRETAGSNQLITLQPTILPKITNQSPYLHKLSQLSPYDYLRLQRTTLQKAQLQTVMGYRLQWWQEPVSGIRMFEVLDGYPQATLTQLNQTLRDRLWREVVNYHDCMSSGRQVVGEGNFQQTVKPTYISPKMLSASIFTQFYCGGAHPDFANEPLNLAIESNQELALEDVLWVGQKSPLSAEHNGFEFAQSLQFDDYRRQQLAPWLVKQFTKLYPKQMAKSQNGGCDYQQPEVWENISWYVTPRGLQIGPSFARVDRQCENPGWTILPFNVVKKYPSWFKW